MKTGARSTHTNRVKQSVWGHSFLHPHMPWNAFMSTEKRSCAAETTWIMLLIFLKGYYWNSLLACSRFLNVLFSAQTTDAYFSHKHVICLVSSEQSEQRFVNDTIFTENFLKFKLILPYWLSLSKFNYLAITSLLITYQNALTITHM